MDWAASWPFPIRPGGFCKVAETWPIFAAQGPATRVWQGTAEASPVSLVPGSLVGGLFKRGLWGSGAEFTPMTAVVSFLAVDSAPQDCSQIFFEVIIAVG